VEDKEEEEKEALIEEHNKDVSKIVFVYMGVQNNMGEKVENKVANKFDGDLKLIEEQIQMPIEKIDESQLLWPAHSS